MSGTEPVAYAYSHHFTKKKKHLDTSTPFYFRICKKVIEVIGTLLFASYSFILLVLPSVLPSDENKRSIWPCYAPNKYEANWAKASRCLARLHWMSYISFIKCTVYTYNSNKIDCIVQYSCIWKSTKSPSPAKPQFYGVFANVTIRGLSIVVKCANPGTPLYSHRAIRAVAHPWQTSLSREDCQASRRKKSRFTHEMHDKKIVQIKYRYNWRCDCVFL